MSDIRITGRMVNFTRLIFDTNDHDKIRDQMMQYLKKGDYTGTLVVIDSHVEQELISLMQLLAELGLQPMAVIDGKLGDQAREIQFPVLPADGPVQRIKASHKETNVSARRQKSQAKAAGNANTMFESQQKEEPSIVEVVKTTAFHKEVLRTGQCLIEDDGDIILMGSTNSGSELISSGNIHIYGSARGRIMAGASGETSAHIFCDSLVAELVSIAGVFCISDDIPMSVYGKRAHIYLNKEQELVFEPLYV